jgi:sugar phosphate isomerase/epimerase
MTDSLSPGKNDISLAEWALVDEIHAGKWTSLDFPRIAREDFNLNGIEFVNTLFGVPTLEYLKTLKQRIAEYGVSPLLIMVDDEGDACAGTKEERRQFVAAHRKWVDIAHFLGCHAIRTNCRGPQAVDKTEALNWSAESYNMLLEYSRPSGISVLIENHGGLSDDADWVLALMKKVNDPGFGTYPDWRKPGLAYDNFVYLQKVIPYAKGMSYRNQPDDALTRKMIELCITQGYRGWYGIESRGREEIRKGIALLKETLFH